MQPFVPVEAVFKGRHFYGADHHPLGQLVHEFLIELEGLSDHDGRSRHWVDTGDDSAVQRYLPEFKKCWSRYARPVGRCWRMDETYLITPAPVPETSSVLLTLLGAGALVAWRRKQLGLR